MNNVVKVGMADYKVTRAPNKLLTLGLGSCVGVIFYDKKNKLAGMAHIMLPNTNDPDSKSLKFANIAMDLMLKDLKEEGMDINRAIIKIAGGSQMFKLSASDEKNSIGYRNVIAVKEIISELKLKIAVEETGGNFGRTIELDLENGNLKIKTLGHGEKTV